LTCYEGVEPERFGVKVISIVPNFEPGRDAILVMGIDERLVKTGPVAGCSGSPVYIQGRLAGALAFGWNLSKDPLYGVTPIRQMLEVGRDGTVDKDKASPVCSWDFSKPIDLARLPATGILQRPIAGPARPVPSSLLVWGMPVGAVEHLAGLFSNAGMDLAVTAVGSSSNDLAGSHVQLAPGAAMMIPLVDGDVRVAVLGTVTAVDEDKVYAFGHSLLGYGPVELPMATARIHTVVSNLSQSFKIGSPIEVVGALTVDDARGVLGQIGATAKTIPMEVQIHHFHQSQSRTFRCRLASHKALTPQLVRSVLNGTTQYFGDLPPDHSISYKGLVLLEGGAALRFANVSSGNSVAELLSECTGAVSLLMDNPFRPIQIDRMEFSVDISNRNRLASIYSVEVADRRVRPGQQLQVKVVLESYPSVKRQYRFTLQVPKQTQPGQYNLSVCGSYEYLAYLRRVAPHRFVVTDSTDLIKAIDYLLNIRRDRLYCILELQQGGIAIERHELPDLPATKALILDAATRTIPVEPMRAWVESSVDTDTITEDKETIKIIVEGPESE
ncbi:MAG: hypothetical protein QHH07_07030, partial [Sedimentisphaerales bacterium]|nr:hypothetical protein [Sedimentisphaerales bacterium]